MNKITRRGRVLTHDANVSVHKANYVIRSECSSSLNALLTQISDHSFHLQGEGKTAGDGHGLKQICQLCCAYSDLRSSDAEGRGGYSDSRGFRRRGKERMVDNETDTESTSHRQIAPLLYNAFIFLLEMAYM